MPRIRYIKPGFFTNEYLCELPPLTRLFFVGLWVYADREGRFEDRLAKLRAVILPYDYDADGEAMMGQLADKGFVVRYQVGDLRVGQIVNFNKHQKQHPREQASELPGPPGDAQSASPTPKKQRQGSPKARLGASKPLLGLGTGN